MSIRDSNFFDCRIIVYLILLIGFTHVSGQGPELGFDHFIDDKGLTQNTVVDLVQDNDGFLWIATPNGLYKYDGQRFTIYRNRPEDPNSLINNYIKELELDPEGNLWIGTINGLSKFNKDSQSFTFFSKALMDKNISALYTDKNGSLWVGTQKSGLYHFLHSDNGDSYQNYLHNPIDTKSIAHNEVLSIEKDKAGNLWVGTRSGLDKKSNSENNKGFEHLGFQNISVNSLFLDEKGRLWIGSEGRVVFCLMEPENSDTRKQITYKKYSLGKEGRDVGDWGVYSFEEDSSGKLWIATKGFGLYWLDPEKERYRQYSYDPLKSGGMSSNRAMTVLLDNTNVLWVGTEVGGLNKCDLNKKKIRFLTQDVLNNNTLSNPSVNSIFEDDDQTLWVGTENGLNKIHFDDTDYQSPVYEHFVFESNLDQEKNNTHRIRSFLKDTDGDYWLGGDAIMQMEIDPNTKTPIFHSTDLNLSDVFSIVQDYQGALWFGSFTQGLVKWIKKKKQSGNIYDFTEAVHYATGIDDYAISDNQISCLYEDSKGNLWIGTLQGGLNLLVRGSDGEKDRFISYQHEPDNSNSLSHNSVFSIHEDAEGNYWIGTFGGGVNKMTFNEKQPVFKHFREKDGLANDAVYGILEDNDNQFWISTDNGISNFDQKTLAFKNYNKVDGLQSNNFRKRAYFKNEKGYLFFGGLKGLNIFHPDDLRDNTILAQPRLTGFKVKNELIKVGEEYNGRVLMDKRLSSMDALTLKHHENTLTFEFAALHFAASENNQFAHKLVGFEEEWINSDHLPFAHYTNLPPGEYEFKVKVSNNDGLWNDSPASIELKVLPPFWLSTWAYLFYGLLLLGIILGFRSYYQLKNKGKVAVRVQKELEAVNRLKLQFFTNISHDFKTNITLIINPLEEILDTFQVDVSLKPKLMTIQRNANSLLRLVNQLMEFRKIEVGETRLGAAKGNIVHFVREITFSFQTLAKKKNIELSFESPLYATDLWFDWDKLEKILKNIIANAVKFSNEDGKIIIRVSKPEDSSVIEIPERQISCKYIIIEVLDNGPGISEVQLPYVFQRFYQVDKSKNSPATGSGIGLAITKDLMDLHLGQIEVDTEEGKGCRFILKLPLGNEHLLPEEIREFSDLEVFSEEEIDHYHSIFEDGQSIHTENLIENIKTTVLIVDDNPDIRDLVRNGLMKKYRILEAINGREALHIAQKELPDLVISDVLMPEMDGIEFCSKLKNNLRTSHIPVILLTALNSVEHRIEGLESGADAYIPKPFKMKLLAVRAEKLIESMENFRKYFLSEEHLTPESIALNSIDQDFLKRIMELMEEHIDDESYLVDQLAADMNTSKSTFFRKLKKLTGQSPNDFIRMVRLKRAAQLLGQNQLSVAEVSYLVGFSDPSYFGKCFRKMFGVAPSRYVANTTKQTNF